MHGTERAGPPGARLAAAMVVMLAGCSSEGGFSPIFPVASVSPAVLQFPDLVAGDETNTQTLYVTNSGPIQLEVTGVAVDDPAFTLLGPTEFVVAEDETVTVDVSFAPDEVVPYEGTLVMSTDDIDNPLIRVPLLGAGRVPYAPDIEIRPSTTVVWTDVAAGDDGDIQVVEIANVGDAELLLESVTQSGSGAFTVRQPTFTVLPGQSTSMLVEFHPPFGRTEGDSGAIVIESNDSDEPEVTVNLEGNGGGDADDYPVAVIDCPGVIDLAGPQLVPLDGSGSTDPFGGTLSYAWDLALRPTGANPDTEVAVDGYDPAQASLLLDAAGVWQVSLTVTSDLSGLTSVPALCVLDAVPADRIRVELLWDGSTSDFDLHLAADLGEFYVTPGDVTWCNTNPDWGVSGLADDDGRLDLDDEEGFGPENINVLEPADGEYQVRVHHYHDGIDGDTTATVVVLLDGVEAWSGSKVLSRNEVWDVGRILWPQAAFSPDNGPPWDAAGVRECR